MGCQQYTVRLATRSDQKRWDDYVVSQSASSPYHLFAWKCAVEEAYGHKGYYLMAEEEKDIVGVLPLMHLRLPLLVNELVALPFCDVGNILSDNETVFDSLLSEGMSVGNSCGIHTIHIRGQMSETSRNNRCHQLKTDKVRMFLNLPASSEVLMKSFKSKLRSQIRKAERNGLAFEWGNTLDLDEYYAVFSRNMRDLGSPVHSKRWFGAILNSYGENARLGKVTLGGKVVGGCIILTVGNKVSIPWASTIRKYNHLAPNMFLYWNALKYSCDCGFKVFDFGRSSRGEGTYKFKEQWGAEPSTLKWYAVSPDKSPASAVVGQTDTGNRNRIADVWRKVPLPIANMMGPRIRKYISL